MKLYRPMESKVVSAVSAAYNATLQASTIQQFMKTHVANITDETTKAHALGYFQQIFDKMNEKERREEYQSKLKVLSAKSAGAALLALVQKQVSSTVEAVSHSDFIYQCKLGDSIIESFESSLVRNAAAEYLHSAQKEG